MKVTDKLKQQRTISIELEPPELGRSIREVQELLDPLIARGVSYVDITYHAEQVTGYTKRDGQSIPIAQRKKPGTAGVAGFIKGRYRAEQVEPVPHIICTGFTKHSTEEFLVELSYLGIENVLALRGDPPKDGYKSDLPLGNSYANELVGQIIGLREGKYVGAEDGEKIDFCIGAACYPEKHKESPDWRSEFHHLRRKVEAGADYLVTQMFFDNEKYKSFVEKAKLEQVRVPIIPGLKPLTTYKQLTILPQLFDCAIPQSLKDEVERHKEDKRKIREIGIEWCIQQCKDLLAFGVPSLHFYAARNAPIEEILKRI